MIQKTAEVKLDVRVDGMDGLNLLNKKIDENKRKISELSVEKGKNKAEIEQLNRETKKLTSEMNEYKRSLPISQMRDFKLELKNMRADLLQTQMTFGENSERAVELGKRIAEMEDAIRTADETAKLFDPGAKFQTMANLANVGANSISFVTSSLQMLGVESGNVEEALLRVNTAMAMAQSASVLADSAKDFQRFGLMAKMAFTSMSTSAKAAFSSIKAGLISTGVGAFVVLLGTLIASWDDVKESTFGVALGLNDLGGVIDRVKQWMSGLGEVITTFVISPFKVLGKVLKGDIKGAMNEYVKGFSVVENFQKGANAKRADQEEQARKVRIEGEISESERLIAVLKARGESTYAIEKKNLEKKLSLHKAGSAEYLDAEKDLNVFVATEEKRVADERKAKAEKAKSERDARQREAVENAKAYRERLANAQKQAMREVQDILDAQDTTGVASLQRQKDREYEILKEFNEKDRAQLKAHLDEKYRLLDEKLKAENKLKSDKAREALDAQIKGTQDSIDQIVKANNATRTLADAKNLEDLENIKMALDAEIAQKRQAEIKQIQEKQKADLAEYERINGRNAGYYQLQNTHLAQIDTLNKSYDDQDVTRTQEYSDAKVNIKKLEVEQESQLIESLGNLMSTASKALGEHTTAGKATAIASTIISTYQSSMDAYKGMVATIPGPWGIAAGGVAAAGAVKFGFDQVKEIIKVKIPNEKGGAGVSSAPAVSKPSVNFQNTPQTQQAESIEKMRESSSEPLRAVVMYSDLQNTESLHRNSRDVEF